MLIFAIFWIVYDSFEFVSLLIDRIKEKEIKRSKIVRSLMDLYLGVVLLFWGLALYDVLSVNPIIFVFPAAVYPVVSLIMLRKQ